MSDFKGRVDFAVSPAVPAGSLMCADETDCDWEKVTMCAFAAGGDDFSTSLKFLSCMDSNKLPLFYDSTIPQKCAGTAGLDWSNVSSCFGGAEGDQLLKEAQKEVIKKIGTGSFSLPLVQVDGRTVCTGENCTYAAVAGRLGGSKEASQGSGSGRPLFTYFFASK